MQAKTHIARTDIHQYGLKTTANNKQGFTLDRSKPSTDPDEQPDEVIIPKGSKYWTWGFKYQPKQFSLTEPTSDQLRYGRYGKNEYSTNIDDYNSRLEILKQFAESGDMDEGDKDSLKTDIEQYKDELQERLDNVPESLQESHVLTERIQELEQLIDEVEEVENEDAEDEEED